MRILFVVALIGTFRIVNSESDIFIYFVMKILDSVEFMDNMLRDMLFFSSSED